MTMLEPGTHLGPYEILELIGKGGMGEVYQATDTRLDRSVAIKVLPEHLAENPERKQRFEREAKVISQLNHPHICTLYDVGHQDGIDYLVMEYIEGETLADRLRRAPLPRDKALEYAVQIADALDKAHRAGIVHRDLKPANIMLTDTGVKLLDFGLARLVVDEPVSDSSDAPTQQQNLTKDQAVVGTLRYMAPEQLEGKPIDARADIWAFGCCLHEMLTGRQRFDADGRASLIAAIVSDHESESDNLLDETINRCLSVDVDRRWKSASDIKHLLAWLRQHRAVATPDSHHGRITSNRWVVAALIALAVVVGWVSATIAPSGDDGDRSSLRSEFSIVLPPTDVFGRSPRVAVSPDGSLLVYHALRNGVEQLFRRSLDRSNVEAIPGTEGGRSPFFSPDGQWVGFFTDGAVMKVGMDGTSPVTVARAQPAGSGSWAADGTIVFGDRGLGFRTIPPDGGESQPIAISLPGETYFEEPHWLPDGGSILFTVGASGQERVAVGSLDTGEARILLEGKTPRFSRGHLLFARNSSVWAVRFDPERLEISGAPVRIVRSVLDLSSAYDVSNDGAIFSIGENRLRNLVWVDRQGRSSLLIETADRYGSPRLSPDGTRVAVETYIRDIWVIDVEQGSRMRLTLETETGLNAVPVWTRDGTAVTFFGEHVEGGRALFLAAADGRSPPEPILARESRPIPGSWSPDGTVLAFHDTPLGEDRDIYLFTPSSGDPPEPFVATSFDENGPAFSPNGQWIAYVSDESGRDEVYVRAYPGPGAKVTVSTDGGIQPVWSPDGRELFYREADRMMVVDVDTGPRFTASKLRVLFQGRYLIGNRNNPSYSVSPDGQRFVMIQDAEGTTPHFGVVLNWLEDVERANARVN